MLTYDTKGIVRALTSHYGLSWQPIADCTKKLGNRGDHYFLVGMTHSPQELRLVLEHATIQKFGDISQTVSI